MIKEIARERLGFEQFRPGQLPAAQALVEGRDVLAVLPTGGGKSAIYELAGLLREGPTVVVSPLMRCRTISSPTCAPQACSLSTRRT